MLRQTKFQETYFSCKIDLKTTGEYVSQNLWRKSGVKNTPDTEDQHGKYIKVYKHTCTHIYIPL